MVSSEERCSKFYIIAFESLMVTFIANVDIAISGEPEPKWDIIDVCRVLYLA